MALRQIDNIEDAWPLYEAECRHHHLKRSRANGMTLNTYVRHKVQQKKRKFSVRQDGQEHAKTGKGEGDAK